MAKKNPKDLKEAKDQVIDMIEKGQLEDQKLSESKVEEPSQDLYPDSFTEEHDESIAPLEKAGSEEIEKDTRSRRFSIEHESTTTKESTLRDSLKKKTDRPSDEGSE